MALSMMAGGSAWAWEGSSDRRFVLEFETGAIWQSATKYRSLIVRTARVSIWRTYKAMVQKLTAGLS